MNPFIAGMIKQTGRSFWQARYTDGRILSEWDTGQSWMSKNLLPIFLNSKTSRWEEVPKKGMIGLRLLCPNGMAGELEAPEGYKFFQLKSGYFDLNMGAPGSQHSIRSHIIGVVNDANGNCLCRAWDYQKKELLQFNDNIYNMKFQNIGALGLEVQGLRV
jgi:hypothetical protein